MESDFFSFYKYMGFETTLSVLSGRKLKYTNPIDFNDPFDIAPYSPVIGRSKHYKRIIGQAGNSSNKDFSTAHGRKKLKAMKIDDKAFRERLLKNWSVTCFSKRPNILPMWAHYADNHQGCVIGFRTNKNVEEQINLDMGKIRTARSLELFPIDVEYMSERPALYDSEGNTSGETALKCFLTKDLAWSYEEEMRAFKEEPTGLYSFRADQLTSVYCGIKMSRSNKALLKSALLEFKNETGVSVKFIEMGMHREKFSLITL